MGPLGQALDVLRVVLRWPVGRRVRTAPIDGPDSETAARIADCDRKLTGYRAALDACGDPAVVSRWITETTAERAGSWPGRARRHHGRP
jgi:hypothetical protein